MKPQPKPLWNGRTMVEMVQHQTAPLIGVARFAAVMATFAFIISLTALGYAVMK